MLVRRGCVKRVWWYSVGGTVLVAGEPAYLVTVASNDFDLEIPALSEPFPSSQLSTTMTKGSLCCFNQRRIILFLEPLHKGFILVLLVQH
jgi:hypothetical protein